MRQLSPLRYPGGKAKFYNNIIKIFNDNNIHLKLKLKLKVELKKLLINYISN